MPDQLTDNTATKNPGDAAISTSSLPDDPGQKLFAASIPDAPAPAPKAASDTASRAASDTASRAASGAVSGAGSEHSSFLQNHPISITSGFFSQHFTSNNHFNQLNYGGGVELQLSKHNSLSFGEYFNSIRKTSVYGTDIESWQIGHLPVKAGFAVGVVSGYRTSWPVIPMALPMVTVEGDKYKHSFAKHLGADFVLIPPIGNKETGTPAVAAVRLKYKFGGKSQ